MGLGKVVGEVRPAGLPGDDELALGDAVPDPVEAHVNCFGLPDLGSAVGDAAGGRVVGYDRRGRLRVAEVGEDGP